MNTSPVKPKAEDPERATKNSQRDSGEAPEPRKLSRLERLKRKIRKLRGKDPDIYPMW